MGNAGAGTASKLAITTQPPSTGTAGSPIGNVVVQVQDINGNLITGSTAAVTISSTPPGVSGTLTVNAAGGIATFSNLQFNTTGTYTVTAASPGLTSATSSSITIGAGPAMKLAITTQPPATGTVGTPIGNVVVQVQDMNGNLVTSSTAAVMIASMPTGVSGTTTVNAAGGVATFSSLMFGATGTYTLTASSTGLTSATSTSIVISSGSTATQLAFTLVPTAGKAGTAISSVQVQVEDVNGHVVTGSTAAVTIASTPAGVTGTTTVNAVNGIATFTTLTFDKATHYTLTATSPGLTSAISSSISITPAAAAQLKYTQRATSGTAGTLLATFAVQIEDRFGNPVSNSTLPVTVSVATGPGPFTPTSTTTVDGVKGVASFTNLELNTSGTYTVTASSPGLTSVTTPSFIVNPSTASMLVFTQEPGNGHSNTKLPTVKVAVEDAFGNQVKTSTAAITIAANGPGTLTTGSTPTVNAANGLAVFNNLAVTAAGTYTFTATSPGLSSATSTSFMVN